MTDLPDDRPPLAVAMVWTSRVTAIALEMVLPGLLGFWVDRRLGTLPLLLLLGAVAGFTAGLWQVIKLGRTTRRDTPTEQDASEGPEKRG